MKRIRLHARWDFFVVGCCAVLRFAGNGGGFCRYWMMECDERYPGSSERHRVDCAVRGGWNVLCERVNLIPMTIDPFAVRET